jgi:hypothetical protein
MEEYHRTEQAKAPSSRRYRGISYTTPINTAKEAVPVIELADRLVGPGQMRRVGEKWVGRCPLPGHEERTPSFTVYPGDGGWHCFGCLRGGDVVDLAALAWGHERMDTAAAEVLWTFGHEIPQRPPTWFRKEERQKAVRDLIHEAKIEVLARRLWRYVIGPILMELEDEEERKEAAKGLWNATELRARQMIAERMGK